MKVRTITARPALSSSFSSSCSSPSSSSSSFFAVLSNGIQCAVDFPLSVMWSDAKFFKKKFKIKRHTIEKKNKTH